MMGVAVIELHKEYVATNGQRVRIDCAITEGESPVRGEPLPLYEGTVYIDSYVCDAVPGSRYGATWRPDGTCVSESLLMIYGTGRPHIVTSP
jgi:hypothetical protein